MPFSARPASFDPHYLFDVEHRAQCRFQHHGTEYLVNPVDVSLNHLCLAVDEGAPLPELGECLEQLELSLLGRHFVIPRLIVRAIRTEAWCPTEIELGLGQCEDTAAILWEISYLLRNRPPLGANQSWDELTLPRIPARGLYTEAARQERLDFVREETGAPLAEVAQIGLDPRKLVSNIEALIGSVEIPVGVAGPLHIKGSFAGGLYYAPLATSEGALVASATRGATALSRSGGVKTRVLGQRMMRVPVFVFGSMSSALLFADWIKDNYRNLAEEVGKYSNYASLEEVQPYVLGRVVHVHFIYETGDAAGQNMTTTCTWQACQWVLKQIKRFSGMQLENFLIEANLSNDKKVTYQTFLKGRGIRVVAEAVLTREVCERILKIDPRQMVAAYQYIASGSIASGMIGMNINVANIIAAMFSALGQDIACVHESALAHLHVELTDNDAVYCTMMLPSLVIGTVGGGTNLPQQRECLEMIGCAGPGKAHKLAEIIASYCLALDISTLSAVASDQFARAHEKLGRNRPVNYLKVGDLNPEWLNDAIQQSGLMALRVQDMMALPQVMTGSSIITELTAHKSNKLIGHFPYRLSTDKGEREVMIKVKPLDAEVILMVNSMASMCNPRLAQEFNQFRDQLGFERCHVRELAVMSQQDPRFVRHAPLTYATVADAEREAFVIIQEKLNGLELMDSAEDTSGWQREHIEAAVRGMAELHAIWLGRETELSQQPWLGHYPTAANMLEKRRLWELLGVHAREEFPEWFSEQDLTNYRRVVHSMGDWWPLIEAMPRTLIHNDFNPRNLAFRREADGGLRLCAYDWELATLHLPQHDLVELLGFSLQHPIDEDMVEALIELHRTELERHSGMTLDRETWRRGYVLALMDMLVNRMPMYVMAHTFRHYPFMERIYRAFRDLLDFEQIGQPGVTP